jgi:hypothetical protein
MDTHRADTAPDRRVGVRTRPEEITVRVMGKDLPLKLGVEHAARLIGVGRSTMYNAVKRGDFDAHPAQRPHGPADAAAAGAHRCYRRRDCPPDAHRITLAITFGPIGQVGLASVAVGPAGR